MDVAVIDRPMRRPSLLIRRGCSGPSTMFGKRTETHSTGFATSGSLSTMMGWSHRRKGGNTMRVASHVPVPPAPTFDMQTMRGTPYLVIAARMTLTESETSVVGRHAVASG